MPAFDRVDLDDVGYEEKFYPRVSTDALTIGAYAEHLAANPRFEFPPLVAVRVVNRGVKYLLLDGVHRYKAYLLAGRKGAPCVVETLPESKWIARAVELNVSHGKQLTSEDRGRVVRLLEADGWQKDKVADLLMIRVDRVDSLREVVAGEDDVEPVTAHPRPLGKRREAHQPRRSRAAPNEEDERRLAQLRAMKVLAAAADVLRGGTLDLDAEGVRDRLNELADLVRSALKT